MFVCICNLQLRYRVSSFMVRTAMVVTFILCYFKSLSRVHKSCQVSNSSMIKYYQFIHISCYTLCIIICNYYAVVFKGEMRIFIIKCTFASQTRSKSRQFRLCHSTCYYYICCVTKTIVIIQLRRYKRIVKNNYV